MSSTSPPVERQLVRFIILGLLTVLVASACGDPALIPIETAPVTGVATYQGKPLESYRVFFYSSEHPAQEPATGLIGPDGRFSLSVRKADDGAIVGPNQVWFVYDPELPEEVPGMETGTPPPPPKVKLPAQYLDRHKSGLTVEVPPEGLKDYKLDLK